MKNNWKTSPGSLGIARVGPVCREGMKEWIAEIDKSFDHAVDTTDVAEHEMDWVATI